MTDQEYQRLEALLRVPSISAMPEHAPDMATAAEMIAGKSGLGYFTWASYVGGNYPQIIIGMISIGIAGYLSSGLIRVLGNVATPWQQRF